MTSVKLCAALGAVLALCTSAATAQSYGPDQPGDPSGYGPPPPPPGSRDQAGPQGYDSPRPDDQWDQSRQYGGRPDDYDGQNGDYNARLARYHAQQTHYQHQLRMYERARRDYDMQFGPGAYERYYNAPPPPPGE